MDYALVAIAGMVAIVGAAALGPRLGVAAPLLLVVVGIGYSFIPGVPAFEIEPEWILAGVLPPLLYAAAINVPIVDLRRNFTAIAGLSVLLVVVSAFVTGFVLFALLPDLDFAAAVALGAVISPTDVVSATSIGKRLGLPARLLTILEGEGLVNDATALVLLRSALAAVALSAQGIEFSALSAIGTFVYSGVVAVVVGLVVGVAAVWVRRKLDNPILDTAISFAVPFIAFLPAERIGASGVIAVVTVGLYSGHASARRFSAQSRVAERINWRTIQFIIENGVFLVMGAQIAGIIAEVHADDLSADQAVYLGLLMTLILIVIRFLFVVPLFALMRRAELRNEQRTSRLTKLAERFRTMTMPNERLQKRRERFERSVDRRQNDVEQLQAEGLGWRGGIVLGWAGMRGVVTLAAAQSLPRDTPYYEQLVLIAFTVAITTLLLEGFTLPGVIRLSGVRGSDRSADRRELASLLEEMAEAGLEALENPDFALPGDATVDSEIVDRVRADTLLIAESAWERAEHADEAAGILNSPHQQYRELRREVLEAEREALLEARSRGAYPSRVLQRAQALLDLEEARLQQLDTGGRDESSHG
jgi:CPA1 family monovalent cation:H+ antiporter